MQQMLGMPFLRLIKSVIKVRPYKRRIKDESTVNLGHNQLD